MIKLILSVSQAPLYDSFLYEDFDSDGAEDFVSTDSEEEHNLTLRDAIEQQDMTLMVSW